MTRWVGVASTAFAFGILAGAFGYSVFSERGAGRRLGAVPEHPQENEKRDRPPWVVEMVARLDREALERQRLERELDALRERVRELDELIIEVYSGREPEAERSETTAAVSADGEEAIDFSLPLAERLTALGWAESRALEIAQRVSARELERLYLRDQATREGWLHTDRYRDELRQVDSDLNGLREEIGDREYDLFLYASGQPNRVVVRSVMEASPAQEAGLKGGDTLLEYDEMRVFSSAELRLATASGEPGELVAVTVLRGREEIQVFVRRGPLGLRVDPVRIGPGSLR